MGDNSAATQPGVPRRACAQVRQLFHAFLETFFELPCSCAAAEERRKASPMKEPSPGMRRGGRKAKVRAR